MLDNCVLYNHVNGRANFGADKCHNYNLFVKAKFPRIRFDSGRLSQV
jgi:hypothetical protein